MASAGASILDAANRVLADLDYPIIVAMAATAEDLYINNLDDSRLRLVLKPGLVREQRSQHQ